MFREADIVEVNGAEGGISWANTLEPNVIDVSHIVAFKEVLSVSVDAILSDVAIDIEMLKPQSIEISGLIFTVADSVELG